MPERGFRRLEPSKITVGGSIANRCVEVKTEWLMLQGLRQLGTSPSRALSVVHLSEPEPWAAPGKLRRGSPSILRASPSLTANSLRLAGRAHALNVAAEFPGYPNVFHSPRQLLEPPWYVLKSLRGSALILSLSELVSYSFIPAKAALRSHNAKAARSSSAGADGVVGRHL